MTPEANRKTRFWRHIFALTPLLALSLFACGTIANYSSAMQFDPTRDQGKGRKLFLAAVELPFRTERQASVRLFRWRVICFHAFLTITVPLMHHKQGGEQDNTSHHLWSHVCCQLKRKESLHSMDSSLSTALGKNPGPHRHNGNMSSPEYLQIESRAH